MKSHGIKLALAFSLLAVDGLASAATPLSSTNKYFDESGALVGQSATLCSNLGWHAGNVHTAYYITEAAPCGGDAQNFQYIVPGTIVTNYVLPGTLSITNACAMAECEPSWTPEVELLQDKGWTWLSGTQ